MFFFEYENEMYLRLALQLTLEVFGMRSEYEMEKEWLKSGNGIIILWYKDG